MNYAGGSVEGITFQKQESKLPKDEQITLQENIVKNYNVADATQHSSWVSKNSLGPVFMYRTERETESKLYPAMNVTIDDNIYTVGTAKPADETAIHYFTLGSNGAQVDFINKKPYSALNTDQKELVNAAVTKIISAINGNGEVSIKTQVIYSDTSFTAGVYPQVVAQESAKSIVFK